MVTDQVRQDAGLDAHLHKVCSPQITTVANVWETLPLFMQLCAKARLLVSAWSSVHKRLLHHSATLPGHAVGVAIEQAGNFGQPEEKFTYAQW